MTAGARNGTWTAAGPDRPADHAHVAVDAAWLAQWWDRLDLDPVGAWDTLVAEYATERAVQVYAATDDTTAGAAARAAAERARAVRAQLLAVLGDPAVLRAAADRIEQTTGSSTRRGGRRVSLAALRLRWRMRRDPVGAWAALVGEYATERAVQTRAETDPTAGAAADQAAERARAVRGRLLAVLGDPAVLRTAADRIEQTTGGRSDQTPDTVHVHAGRGDNEHGVPRRTLTGSLEWERYDGGQWRLWGYGHTHTIAEDDVAGAQEWAASLMADGYEYEDPGVAVFRWEHHRDDYGDWWEPVTSGRR